MALTRRARSWHRRRVASPVTSAAERRRMYRRRRVTAAAVILAAFVAFVGLLAAVDLLVARSRLLSARTVFSEVADNPAAQRTPEGRAATLRRMDGAIDSVRSGRRRVTDPLIGLLGRAPLVRTHHRALLSLIDDSETAAVTGRELLAGIDQIAATEQLAGGKLPLDALTNLSSRLEVAGAAIGRLAGAGAAPAGPVGDARRIFNRTAASNSRRLLEGAEAAKAARSFMGGDGPRRYLVALQNNAEMRNQGAVLSYVVARLDGGALGFEEGGSVGQLSLDTAAPVELPPGTAEIFGVWEPNRRWQTVNTGADFALSGRMMVAMYQKATGEALDGVIAIDIPGIAGLLRVLGPVSIAEVAEPIGPDNIARLLLHDFYEGIPPIGDQGPRRERLGDVVGAVIARLTAGAYDAVSMSGELGDAAAGGHLKLWSSTDGEEKVFERSGLGGGPAVVQPDRTFHLAVENRTATKLDYYVKPSVRYDVELAADGSALVHTTVTMANTAPVGAAPSYQLGPDDFTQNPGDYIAWVLLWGPAGSEQRQNGISESGLNLAQRVVDIGPGQTREASFDTFLPDAVRNGIFELRLVPQPRLEPVPVEVYVSGAGWRVSGAPRWAGDLDRTRSLRWKVRR